MKKSEIKDLEIRINKLSKRVISRDYNNKELVIRYYPLLIIIGISILFFSFLLYGPTLTGMVTIKQDESITYYMDSIDGNDLNSGTNSNEAWKTITKLNSINLNPGDTVLFKRGSTWNLIEDDFLDTYSGEENKFIKYGAYSQGDKPRFIAVINLSNPDNWSNVNTNIWEVKNIKTDVGMVFFNYSQSWGRNFYNNINNLEQQGDFTYNKSSDRLYLYSIINPGNYYKNIIISMDRPDNEGMIQLTRKNYIIISNLSLFYGAVHGINAVNSSFIKIVDCNLGYIGGNWQNSGINRYGNCITFGLNANNSLIQGNNITQCFDTGISHQAWQTGSAGDINNHEVKYNTITYSGYGYELFNSVGRTENISIHHNTFTNCGRGFFNTSYGMCFRLSGSQPLTKSISITDNIIYNSNYREIEFSAIKNNWKGEWPTLDYNLYYKGRYNLFTWNGTSYSDLEDIKNKYSQIENNGLQDDPLFISQSETPSENSPACNMSSTGSYVGALPCVGQEEPSNSPPTQTSPLLLSSDHPLNLTNASLTCYNQSTSDPDGDSVTNSYKWFRNESIVGGQTTNTISSGTTSIDDSWLCEITPNDGTVDGTPLNSSSLRINTIPSVCGDLSCNGIETCNTCPGDCGTCPLGNNSAIISNLRNESTTNTTTEIHFSTDKESNTTICYGTTTYSNCYRNSSLSTNHRKYISGLSSMTYYKYNATTCVSSESGANCTSQNSSFRTSESLSQFNGAPAPLIIVIGNHSTTNISSVITWAMDKSANATLCYGTSSYSSCIRNSSTALTQSFWLGSLAINTGYIYNVTSCVGTETTANCTSQNKSFRTLENNLQYNGIYHPTIISLTNSSTTNKSTVLSWSVDIPANSSLCYGVSSYGTCAYNSTPSMNLGFYISSLVNSTNYIYNITSCTSSEGGNNCTSENKSFRTNEIKLQYNGAPAPLIISLGNVSTRNTSTIITWTMNKAANATICYGTNSYSTCIRNSTTSSVQSFWLGSLAINTNYIYNITSCVQTDTIANCTSENKSFRTSENNLQYNGIHKPIISLLRNTSTTNSSTAITWSVDIPANSSLCYGINNYGTCTYNSTQSMNLGFYISSLMNSTYYQYNITSCTSSEGGNNCTSENKSFRTSENIVIPSDNSTTDITSCTLESKTWNEDEILTSAFNLSDCFNDPLNNSLNFSSIGTVSINITIDTNGIVNLSQPENWNGIEYIIFIASADNRSAQTNNITLTVSNVADCGLDGCESGETCSTCPADCGACPAAPSGGGGGGSSGGYAPSSNENNVSTEKSTSETNNIPNQETEENTKEESIVEQPLEITKNTNETNGEESKDPYQESPNKSQSASITNTPPPLLIGFAFIITTLLMFTLYSEATGKVRIFKKKVKKEVSTFHDTQKERQKQNYYYELVEYLNEATTRGYSKSKIKDVMRETGIPKAIINDFMKKKYKASKRVKKDAHGAYYQELNEYIKQGLEIGYSKEVLESNLINAAWPSKLVDDMLNEYLGPSKDTIPTDIYKPLEEYINEALKRGMDTEKVKSNLIEAGWRQDILDRFFK